VKVLLIGGTGLVGRYLLPRLISRGDEVFALTRSEEKARQLKNSGSYSIVGNIRDPGSFIGKLPGRPEIIVLLAMPGVKPGKRMTKKKKAALRKETTDFFRNSMDLALQYDIPVILPGGTSYKTCHNEVADESWPILRTGLTEIGADTDQLIADAIRSNNPSVIQLIYGKIYGNGGLFRVMYDMMKKGRGGIIGSGNNYIPNIHAYDAASAIIKSIEKLPVGEKFIIADDTPVDQKEFTCYLAQLMHKKKPGHIPAFLIRLIIGKDFFEVIRMNCRVSNEKAKRILDWKPVYPSYKEGLEATIKEITEEKKRIEQ
jgi:nucleoside-diphosphate-sugar epimerase